VTYVGQRAVNGAEREPAKGTVLNTCMGGCGKAMPAGQKCYECAVTAVDVWRAAKRGDGVEPPAEDATSKSTHGLTGSSA